MYDKIHYNKKKKKLIFNLQIAPWWAAYELTIGVPGAQVWS